MLKEQNDFSISFYAVTTTMLLTQRVHPATLLVKQAMNLSDEGQNYSSMLYIGVKNK